MLKVHHNIWFKFETPTCADIIVVECKNEFYLKLIKTILFSKNATFEDSVTWLAAIVRR